MTIIGALAVAAASAAVASRATAAVVVVNADITASTTWVSSNEYVLQKPIFVRNGARLTISAGTVVRGQPKTGTGASPGMLIVSRDGDIIASGTAASPVIFTTAATDNNNDGVPDISGGFHQAWDPGDAFFDDNPKTVPLAPLDANGNGNTRLWGGVAVLGNAPTNLARVAANYGVGRLEAHYLGLSPFYGGKRPGDSSGILRYVSIRHTGAEASTGESNFPAPAGLTLAGVGNGTIIENVEVYASWNRGIEWKGGTVHGKNLVVFFAGGDALHVDQGYTGVNQFVFVVNPYFNENDGGSFGISSGEDLCDFEGDDFAHDIFAGNVNIRLDVTQNYLDTTPWPLANASFWNMTLIGSSPNGALAYSPTSAAMSNNGCVYKSGGAGYVFNSIVLDTGSNPAFLVGSGGAPGYSPAVNIDNDLAAAVCVSVENVNGLANDADLIGKGDTLALSLVGGTSLSASGPLTNGVVNGDPSLPLTGNDAGHLNGALNPRGATDATKLNPRLNAGPNSGLCPQSTYPGSDAAATYRGAFKASGELWTTGWTVLNVGGVLAD